MYRRKIISQKKKNITNNDFYFLFFIYLDKRKGKPTDRIQIVIPHFNSHQFLSESRSSYFFFAANQVLQFEFRPESLNPLELSMLQNPILVLSHGDPLSLSELPLTLFS
jgi:hypothetical protein